MSSQNEQKTFTAKEALLRAAEALFCGKGYAAVSTRELAEAAGVNLGAIQYHFGSKAALFLETTQRLLKGSVETRAFLEAPTSEKEAAYSLYRFVQNFLDHLLRPSGPQGCRLMFREILAENPEDSELYEDLVAIAVKEVAKPTHELLLSIFRHLLPQASEDELMLSVQTVIGQCSFYVTHRAFIERLHSRDFSQSPLFEEVTDHITSFTLRAVGCSESIIEEVILRERLERA